jgi:hypothetical protein
LSLLAPCYTWWRYPVKPPKPRVLDHTKLGGKKRAIHPVTRFTKAQCAAYVPEVAKQGHYGRLRERDHGDLKTKRCRRDEARKLVLPGTWTFLGADRPWRERWQFTEAPRRKGRPVPPSFKGEWKRLHNLPPWRGPAKIYRIKGKVVGPARFDWKPDRQYCFEAWEQRRFVRWTRTPRPSMADFRHFIAQK